MKKELDMSFEAVWGFDPYKAMRANGSALSKIATDETTYGAEEQKAARIPSDAHGQIYELRRMYRI